MTPAPEGVRPGRRTRRLGLRSRVALAFALGALVLSAGLAVLTYQLARSYLMRHRETSVLRQTYANARLVKNALRSDDVDIPRLLTSVELPAGSSPLLYHGDTWFGTSVGAGRETIPADLRQLVVGGTPARQRYVRGGVPQLVAGIPLPAVGGAYFEIFPLTELDRTLETLRNSSLAAAAITACAGAAVGWRASRRVLSPVAAVASAAAAISGGRFDVRLDEYGDPDLSTMAVSFNRMTDALEDRIRRDARFASDVSHELRSPLTTLGAALEVVNARKADMPERARAGVELLGDEVRRFQRLVEDLLEISRLDAGAAELSRESVVLSQFVLEAVRSRSAAVTAVDIEASAVDTVVQADKRRLERVLTNLVDNADLHGGGVDRVVVRRVGERVQIVVEDRGPGVPCEERERIFERFARGRAAGQRGEGDGTGLGLSLVREHVRLHGGRTWVEDGDDGGARFVVDLPVTG